MPSSSTPPRHVTYWVEIAGKKAELQDRIRAQLPQQHSSSIEQIQVETILFSDMTSENLDDKTLSRECRELLDNEAKDAEIIRDHEPVRWGNRKGLTVLEKLETLEDLAAETAAKSAARDAETAARSAAQDAEIDRVKDELALMKDELALLKASSDGYLQIRNRFVAVYRRQVLKDATPDDRGLVDVGNSATHDGDPVTDALLYQRGIRSDDRTYASLYGMEWESVLSCNTQQGKFPRVPCLPPTTSRALRSKCESYKVSTTGKKAELQDCIRAHEAQLQQQDSSSIEQIQVEAILFSDITSENLDDETLSRECRELLDNEAKDVEIIRDDEPVRGENRKGLTVLEKLEDLAAETAALKATVAAKSAARDAEIDKVKDERPARDRGKEASRPATGPTGATSASAKMIDATVGHSPEIHKAPPGIYAINKFTGKNYGPTGLPP
ncbi:MAG: hypothetical protein M1826_007049 [Phylliscum demangeonii]|nr:MAG: hypothetical protein M1826_007049 [Phylliscum demangeonii]